MDASTVATLVLEDVHGLEEAAVPLPVSWLLAPRHNATLFEIVGNALTVTATEDVY